MINRDEEGEEKEEWKKTHFVSFEKRSFILVEENGRKGGTRSFERLFKEMMIPRKTSHNTILQRTSSRIVINCWKNQQFLLD